MPAARLLANDFSDVGDIDQLLIEQKRPVESELRDIGTRTGFRDGCRAGLDTADADGVINDLNARGLFIGLRQGVFSHRRRMEG